jgi:hypothetical protein
MVALTSACVIRSFLSTTSESATSERILHSLSSEINRILGMLLLNIRDITREAQSLYQANLILFDEGDLGEINYYAVNIDKVTSLQATDSEYVVKIDQLSTLFGALPNIIRHRSNSMLKKLARHGVFVLTYPPHPSHIFQFLDVLLSGLVKRSKKYQIRDDTFPIHVDHILRLFEHMMPQRQAQQPGQRGGRQDSSTTTGT